MITQTGVMTGRRRRAVDSTILADAVATQDTITQLILAIRRVGRVVPGGSEAIAAVCTGHDYSRAGKPQIDWEEPGAKDALVSALVNDANALLEALAGIDEQIAAEEMVAAALAKMSNQLKAQTAPTGGGVSARRVAPDGVISQVDPDARHTRKSPEAHRDGCRAHVVAEPETRIITDEALTMAAGTENSDAAVAEQFLTEDTTTSGGGREWYGDSAYGTVDLRGAIRDAGHDLEFSARYMVQLIITGQDALEPSAAIEVTSRLRLVAGDSTARPPEGTVLSTPEDSR